MINNLSDKAKKNKQSISPIRQIMSYADSEYIRNLGIDPEELISYAGGWVNHDSPEELRKAYNNIISDKNLFYKSGAYPPSLGNPDFKRAIIDFENHIYGMEGLYESNIAVGLGSTQIAMNLFQVLLNPGDKILLLDPSYCNYPMQILTGIMDVEIMRYPVIDEQNWQYIAEEKLDNFCDFIHQNKPKIVLLVSPDNPTSKILSTNFVKSTLSAIQDINGFLIVDYAYKEIVFDMNYPEYFSWGPNDNYISLRTNSKWCRGMGRRLGWIEAPEFIIESLDSFQNSTILCPDMLHQMALTEYIKNSINNNTLLPYLMKMNELYKHAADRTIRSIKTYLDYPVFIPDGGIYTIISIDRDGAEFVDQILKNTGVLCVPGWGFGRSLNQAVRISYGPLVNELEKIELGFKKIAAFLKK